MSDYEPDFYTDPIDEDAEFEAREAADRRYRRATLVHLSVAGALGGGLTFAVFSGMLKAIRASEDLLREGWGTDQRAYVPFVMFIIVAGLLGWVMGWYNEHRSAETLLPAVVGCGVCGLVGFGLSVAFHQPMPISAKYVYLVVAGLMMLTAEIRSRIVD